MPKPRGAAGETTGQSPTTRTEPQFGFYRHNKDSYSTQTTTLAEVYERTVNPSPAYAATIEAAREARRNGDKGGYDRIKKTLPAFAVGGTFHYRNKNRINEPSGFIVLDFDLTDELEAEACKLNLAADPRTHLAFISPSGEGVKAVISYRLPDDRDGIADYYSAAVAHLKEEIEELAGYEPDGSGKDISRLCYYSHDLEAYYNPAAVPFDLPADLGAQVGKRRQRKDRAKRPRKDAQRIHQATPLTPGLADHLAALADRLESASGRPFGPNNRNAICFQFACACNRLGVAKADAVAFLEDHFEPLPEEHQQTMAGAYRRHSDEWNETPFQGELQAVERTETLEVDKYAGEQLEAIERSLLAHRHSLFLGVPGVGKTTAIIEIGKRQAAAGRKVCMAFPTRAIGRQMAKKTGLPYYDGSSPRAEKEVALEAGFYLTNIKQLGAEDVQADLVFLDEAHDFLYNYPAYRRVMAKAWPKLLQQQVVFLTATPRALGAMLGLHTVCVRRRGHTIPATILTHTGGHSVAERTLHLVQQLSGAPDDSLLIVEENNRNTLELVRRLSVSAGLLRPEEIAVFHAENKDDSHFQHLLRSGTVAPHCRLILTTSVAECGVNINAPGRIVYLVHFWGAFSNPTSPVQLWGRVRTYKELHRFVYVKERPGKQRNGRPVSAEEHFGSHLARMQAACRPGKKYRELSEAWKLPQAASTTDCPKLYYYEKSGRFHPHELACAAWAQQKGDSAFTPVELLRQIERELPELAFTWAAAPKPDLSPELRSALKRGKKEMSDASAEAGQSIIATAFGSPRLWLACIHVRAGEDRPLRTWAQDEAVRQGCAATEWAGYLEDAITLTEEHPEVWKLPNCVALALARRIKELHWYTIPYADALREATRKNKETGLYELTDNNSWGDFREGVPRWLDFYAYAHGGKHIFRTPDRRAIEAESRLRLRVKKNDAYKPGEWRERLHLLQKQLPGGGCLPFETTQQATRFLTRYFNTEETQRKRTPDDKNARRLHILGEKKMANWFAEHGLDAGKIAPAYLAKLMRMHPAVWEQSKTRNTPLETIESGFCLPATTPPPPPPT